ncbi:cyclase family protein [Pseudarthrobacter sp. MM222]|uniref:cyclase family protein n=1 Tax=Pseudarthrobacter sp. MM222 TaxID=3018929 RepID=UPI0024CC151A|nr:Kynurenine formamidase [Pseudarthrobacter sp. MM222]
MTWFDLSVPLHTGMPVYPGDPEVVIAPALSVAADGANVLSLSLGSHSGTHADAPLHVHDGWPALDDLPLFRFSGLAELVDVRGVGLGGRISAAHLAGLACEGSSAVAAGESGSGEPGSGEPGKILLLHTGSAAAWGSDEYLKHPWLDADAAQLIVDRGYRAVGVDALSVDPSSGGPAEGAEDGVPAAGGAFPAHEILAGSGCVIVENLTGLEQVQRARDSGAAVEVFLFPLNVPGSDGAPVRAVARPVVERAVRPPQWPNLGLDEVQAAADSLVAAFAATDTVTYFAAFSPDATYIFHPEAESLGSRSAYRALWDGWVAAGWRVLECRSSERNIQLLGTTAVFSHRVATTVRTDSTGGTFASDERETIVFARAADGGVLAVHEHLSSCPA